MLWRLNHLSLRPSEVFVARTAVAASVSSRRNHSFLAATPIRHGPVGPDPGANFKKFSEIDGLNSSRVDQIRRARTLDDDWVAGEKVHGANFGFYVINDTATKANLDLAVKDADDELRVRWGKRTGFIPDGSFFYGYQSKTALWSKQAKQGYHICCKHLGKKRLNTFVITGEIFGGKYMHPQVDSKIKKDEVEFEGTRKKVSPVQKDDFPQYHPNLGFFAFDVKYRVTDQDDFVHMCHDDAKLVLNQIDGLLVERPLIRGSLDRILAMDIESMQTTLPGLCPALGDYYLRNNKAEGIVIRHAKRVPSESSSSSSSDSAHSGGPPTSSSSSFSSSSTPQNNQAQTIIKVKCKEFEEMYNRSNVEDALADERKAALARVGPQLPDIAAVFPTKKEQMACQLLCDHVVENRLSSVVSKVGEEAFLMGQITQDQLAFQLAQDAIKDYLKNLTNALDANVPLILRREMCRYCLFAAKRLVARKWDKLIAQAEPEEAANAPQNA